VAHGLHTTNVDNIKFFYPLKQSSHQNAGQNCNEHEAIPVQAQRVPGGSGSQTSRQSAHKGGKAAFNPQEIFLVLIYVRD
jgi:hypothetical protein